MLNLGRSIILVLLVCGFCYFIWPSPYSYYNFKGSTVRVDRFGGCQHVKTPSGFVTLGGDARCFLISEKNRQFGTYFIGADPLITRYDDPNDVFESQVQDSTPDLGYKRQLKIISQIIVILRLRKPQPQLEVINNSKCEILSINFNLPGINNSEGSIRFFDTEDLKPGQSIKKYISIPKSNPSLNITIESVMFEDRVLNKLADSICAQ